ncbi:FHA domain-containing protein [Botrimarina hoheduenensis]|uniref:Transcriptional regulatory protein EmbR n=1 Tax=Botrimarina hoheduenensis TaxID=2528000 RepID=A0A5C5VVU2_9BACT|nr:FHA domain-containing protein [Botrimarina hoheduenensis]TWT42480.1 Transcriptional regulatory protein EmbR [Botrimarina hoheduenensis]
MKLVVLAGSKKNSAVPLKKDRLTVGRSSECSLRVGSDAISRKHCEFVRTAEGVIVQDLGSRNGTIVNEVRIEQPTRLNHGDTIKIGPLEFRFELEAELSDLKLPKVDGVADAVARTADKGRKGAAIDDSISDWLLGPQETVGPGTSVNETLALSADETRAITEQFASADSDVPPEEAAAVEAEDPKDKKKKKEPGKLPANAFGPKAKDSREAAEKILRDMARRR